MMVTPHLNHSLWGVTEQGVRGLSLSGNLLGKIDRKVSVKIFQISSQKHSFVCYK